MRAGRIRHRVTIQSESQTADGAGGYGLAWTDLATTWAAVEPLNGRERLQADQVQDETTHQITMRYRSDVVPIGKYRVLFGTRTFNVTSVINPDERNISLTLLVEEGVPT